MKKYRIPATALAAAAFLAGCGGSDPGDQSSTVAFTRMVNFGDSLSDVGTYDVGFVEVAGGGHYSINGVGATGQSYINWTEFLAAMLDLTQPCAAETGLDIDNDILPAATYGTAVTATFHDTGTGACLNYAQGGARVENAIGPGNAALVVLDDSSTYSNAIGQLTVPVVTQIANFLAHGNTFTSTDLVTVMAGGNDLFIALDTFEATVAAGGDSTAAATTALTAMVAAADEEADLVTNQIIANGATHVVVVDLPDVSLTPLGIEAGTSAQALILEMVNAFNTELAAKLTASDSLLFVDAETVSQSQAADPSQYGLTNVTTPACDLTVVSSSLLCTADTLIGTASSVATYQYADTVHPTPLGYRLLASLVGAQMAIKGWL